MRYLKYLILAVVAIALIVLAVANRGVVTLKLLPTPMSNMLGMQETMSLPLFVVIFGGIAVGLLLGFVWEWLREHKHRSYARKEHKQVVRLEREVKRLKGEKHEGKDDVLALVEETR